MGEPSSSGADTTALMLGALAGAAVVVALVIAARRVCGQRLHACMRPLCPQFADAFIKCGKELGKEKHSVWKYSVSLFANLAMRHEVQNTPTEYRLVLIPKS